MFRNPRKKQERERFAAVSWPSPAGRKKKAQRFNAGNKHTRCRVPSGTTEAPDDAAILSSLRDLVLQFINTMTFVAPNLACGKTRGGSISRSGSVTDEQRRHRPNSAQPEGRPFFFGQTSLLAPYRSTAGYARRSRLVWPKNPWPRTSPCL